MIRCRFDLVAFLYFFFFSFIPLHSWCILSIIKRVELHSGWIALYIDLRVAFDTRIYVLTKYII